MHPIVSATSTVRALKNAYAASTPLQLPPRRWYIWPYGSYTWGKDEYVQHYRAPEGLAPGPGYSHAVTGRGRWVATAGQVALDDTGQLVGAGDPAAQTRQVFENLGRALAAADASFADVIKLNYYVTDITMLPAVRAIRDRHAVKAVTDRRRSRSAPARWQAGAPRSFPRR